MINCQERVSCQLASDLCALCPNHLLRGKRSCLSYYNSLYSHLCHGKGELPCHGLQLTVTRHRSCLVPVCHLCVPCKYCLVEKKTLILWSYSPTTLVPFKVNTHLARQGKALIWYLLTNWTCRVCTETVYKSHCMGSKCKLFKLSRN